MAGSGAPFALDAAAATAAFPAAMALPSDTRSAQDGCSTLVATMGGGAVWGAEACDDPTAGLLTAAAGLQGICVGAAGDWCGTRAPGVAVENGAEAKRAGPIGVPLNCHCTVNGGSGGCCSGDPGDTHSRNPSLRKGDAGRCGDPGRGDVCARADACSDASVVTTLHRGHRNAFAVKGIMSCTPHDSLQHFWTPEWQTQRTVSQRRMHTRANAGARAREGLQFPGGTNGRSDCDWLVDVADSLGDGLGDGFGDDWGAAREGVGAAPSAGDGARTGAGAGAGAGTGAGANAGAGAAVGAAR